MHLTIRDIKKYIPYGAVKNILHVGAHECQKKDDYNRHLNVKDENIFWVEGNPAVYKKMLCNTEIKNIYKEIISEEDGKEVTFNITNNGQSSSILELGTHSVHHPEVVNISSFKGVTKTITTVCKQYIIPSFNFLTLDIQGAELMALKGISDDLYEDIDYILTKINVEEVYKGCALFDDVKSFLKEKGYVCVESKLTKWKWGNAFFVKKSILKYLYCRPIGGFNDQLSVIGRCYDWCSKNKRIMILDTVHPECCYNVSYTDFFEDLPCGIVTNVTEIMKFVNIKTYTDPDGKGQFFKENDKLSTFDLSDECYNEDDKLLFYIGFGTGDGYELFFKKLALKQEIIEEFKEKYEKIAPYISVQVRNTDLKSDEDYREMEIEDIEDIKNIDNIFNIHVATDDPDVLQYYREKYGTRVYNFATLGSNQYGLHYHKNISGKTQVKELLIDLLLMGSSKSIKSISKGGFIRLARSLWNEKNLIEEESNHSENCKCTLCKQSEMFGHSFNYNSKKETYDTVTISTGTLKGVDIDHLIDSYKEVDKAVNPIVISTWKEDLTPEIKEKLEANSFIVLEGAEEGDVFTKCERRSVNLQLCTIKPAVEYAKNLSCKYMIKIRNDFYPINYNKLLTEYELSCNNKIGCLGLFSNQYVNMCYYDQLIIASRDRFLKYFDVPFCIEPHLNPEHYLLWKYTGNFKFDLNVTEYKQVFHFLCNDFEKLGIDFVWDRTRNKGTPFYYYVRENKMLFIKDDICMYKDLVKDSYNTVTLSVGTLKGVNIDKLIDSYKAVDKAVNPVIVSSWKEDLTPEIKEKLEANSFIVLGYDLSYLNSSHLKIRNSVNLQLCTIKQGIDYIKKLKCKHIIKTRHDLYPINFEKILENTVNIKKISVLSFFANPDEKLYYLDHFVMGPSVEVIRFFDLPYCEVQQMYPEYYFLMNYTNSSKFRLNHHEYKAIFNFLADDFEKLGIDFEWDRSRGSESDKTVKASNQKLIGDNVCMYRELLKETKGIFFREICFQKVSCCEIDSYFGDFFDDSFSFELSFIKNFGVKAFIVSERKEGSRRDPDLEGVDPFYEVDPKHPKVYWIKKDITFINESLIKMFLKQFSNSFVKLKDTTFLNVFLNSKNKPKQIAIEIKGDTFYETNHLIEKTHSRVYEDLKGGSYLYIKK